MPETADPVVYIVDDDEDARFGLRLLLESAGHRVEEFSSGAEFLDRFHPSAPACLILDIRMPILSGLELQKRLSAQDRVPPIIFLTGHGTVPEAVEALKSGAVDFFQKPLTEGQPLLDRVSEAIGQDLQAIHTNRRHAEIRALLDKLTPRELEVMEMICEGKANKVIAIDLGISERTVELHRGHLMKKLGVRSIPELIEIKNALE